MTLLLIIIGVNLAAWFWVAGKAITQADPADTTPTPSRSHQV